MGMICKEKAHTEAEKDWAKGVISALPNVTGKYIREHKVCEEYKTKFDKDMTVAGMYYWLRIVRDPELKKRLYAQKKMTMDKNREKRGEGNARFLREKETFEKSNILAYVNHHIVGFENDVALKEFLMQNQVIG